MQDTLVDIDIFMSGLLSLKLILGGKGGVIGGYRELLRFELLACYHPNLRIFWSVWLFQKNFCHKKDPTPVKSLFEEKNGKSIFGLFRHMGILFSNLLLKSIFDFGKWSNWKYGNTCICVFSVWLLPKVKNWFQKHIWKENAPISIQIFLRVLINI